ncbi:Protein transport protein Sec61 subunit gamma, partial [Linum grandiflorum]
IDNVFDLLREFAKDSVRLVKRCHKPSQKAEVASASVSAMGGGMLRHRKIKGGGDGWGFKLGRSTKKKR